VPALRERLDDLPILVDHFLEANSQRTGKPRKKLHPELMAAFYEWHWPGNVRELENEIERLVVLSGDAEVIPPDLRAQRPAGKSPGSSAHLAALVHRGLQSDMATAVGALEKELIETGLREVAGNKSKLASMLGVSRTTLIKKIREYGIAE
jgi:transcriptional regulator with PAS, ATPase and Fis domain